MTPRGRCLCGALRFAFDAAAVASQNLCHCGSCRRASGAPVVAWITVRDTGWRWTRGSPRLHASSPGVTRGFCGACGSPMSYATAARPQETDFPAAALVDPSQAAPTSHEHWDERLPWLALADDLPKREGAD